MKIKTTRDYINEIIKLYDSICKLKQDDFTRLIELKEAYLRFNEKVELYNIFSNRLEKSELEFLNNKNVKNFSNEHKELEGFVWYHLMYGILPGLMAGSLNRQYLINSINLSRLCFAVVYKKVPFYAYGVEEKGRVLVRTQNYTDDEIRENRNILKKEKRELKDNISKESRLSTEEINILKSTISPFLTSYKSFVEEYFFEIRDLFRWYNKEIRIYVTNIYNRDFYHIVVYPYASDLGKLYIFPRILKLYSELGCNNEEIEKNEINFWMMISPGKSLRDFTGKNLLSITEDLPLSEILEIFWGVSSSVEKVQFSEKLFTLLGYKIDKDKTSDNIFTLRKKCFKLDSFFTHSMGRVNKVAVLILSNNQYLSISNIDALIDTIHCNRKRINKSDFIFTIANVDTPSEEKLLKNGIHTISLERISKFLIQSNLFEFLSTFLKNSILKVNKKELRSEIEKKQFGDKLKERINNLDTGKANFKSFENLMVEVFDFLLKDSFRNYVSKPQAHEYEGHRKRDLVISNVHPLIDFWKLRKVEQNAKRIIIDFKNYTTEISQEVVNSVAKYLNPKRGNFAIIVTQKGINSSGIKEQKIKYFDEDKLIVHMDKTDLTEMINYKINNQCVEDILERKVAEISI